MGIVNSKVPFPLLAKNVKNNEIDEKENRRVLSLVLDFADEVFNDIENDTTSILVNQLLIEAEEKLLSSDYMESIELYTKASILGSVYANAKLGLLYLEGYKSIQSDYRVSAGYFSIALKLILLIPPKLWNFCHLLEIIAGLSELYRFHLVYQRDYHIWFHGIKLMKKIETIFQDPNFIKLTHEENQKRRAIRIHMTYCFALNLQAEQDFVTALKMFEECERIGYCGYSTADKLVKKAHTQYRLLEPRVPRVLPICASCNYEAKKIDEIWKLIVCSKCQTACCTRECMIKHRAIHNNLK
ncbi:11258_t:CDS:2 [Diversispora eburnea]|uniref:11258_t:CDS:1 n=1 Tax=Diversispora eburnea TaxID=1213867 RepID=A0A9N8YZY5_9GLOM|nr:11258_t:CDS:2 [Diversispora eburnea]